MSSKPVQDHRGAVTAACPLCGRDVTHPVRVTSVTARAYVEGTGTSTCPTVTVDAVTHTCTRRD